MEKLWVDRIDRIIAGRLDRKGIIHTKSYQRARVVQALSKYSNVMLLHDSKSAREIIDRFKRSPSPCVLVSPSVEEGYDFIGDLARYQIIAKVPFMDTRSALAKARSTEDKDWVYYEASQSIVQMHGRIVRAMDDFGETFIVDEHFTWFRKRVVWPKSFRLTWRDVQVSAIPAPPPLATSPTSAIPSTLSSR
jgi:Rad3-related DNA helicase